MKAMQNDWYKKIEENLPDFFYQQLFRDVGERQEQRFRLSTSVPMPRLHLGRKYSIIVTEIPWVSEHEKRRHCGRKRGNEYESA